MISLDGKRKREFYPNKEVVVRRALELQKSSETKPIMQKKVSNADWLTLSEFLTIWFEKQQTRVALRKKKTLSVEKDLTYLKPIQKFFGRKNLHEISESLLEKYQILRTGEDIKPVTINSEIRTLKAILNLAVKLGYLNQVPKNRRITRAQETYPSSICRGNAGHTKRVEPRIMPNL